MNTHDLARHVADSHDLPLGKAREVVAGVVDAVAAAIARGEEVSVPGLGRFRVKDTAARSGRNPRTGEPMAIAAGKKISFAPAKGASERRPDIVR